MIPIRLTKTMLNSLDPSHIAMDIRPDDPKASIAIRFALSTVESYLTEAAVQQRRIIREQKTIQDYFKRATEAGPRREGRPQPRPPRHRPNAFRSVHFYLTCWRMVGGHLTVVAQTCGLPEVRAALEPHKLTIGKYREMRDHYEHFDERLPGRAGPRTPGLRVPGDLGNFSGYTLTFGGKKVDIGPNSMVLLKRIVDEVLTAFKLGALRKMSSVNPRIIEGWLTPLRVKYLQRYFQRQMKANR